MRLRFSLKRFLITLILIGAVFAFLYQRSCHRRVVTHQLFENGFTLAYDQSSINREWINQGFGGHQPVDKPPNAILDSPSNNTWLSALGMLELANQIEFVDGKRTPLDKKSFTGFDNDDLKPIARLSAVKEVLLSWNSVDDRGLKYLSGLSNLQRLELDGCPVSDNGMQHLANLKSITHLSLAFTEVTDDGILELRNLKELQYLSLEGTAVSSNVFPVLENFMNLKVLNLSRTKIGQANVEKLAHFRGLEELYISDTGIGDLHQVLPHLPNLRWLVVDGTKLGDNLIAELTRSGIQLDGLSVERTSVSQESLSLIWALKLKYSFAGNASGLTFEQIEIIEDDISSRRGRPGG